MKYVKLFEQYLNEVKLYTNYGDYNTEDNIQKLKDMGIKFPTEEEFVDLVESNCIDNGEISVDGTKKVEEEIRNKYGKDFTFGFSDHPYGYSKWLNKNCGSNFYLTYDPFMQNKSSYLGCIYMYEVKLLILLPLGLEGDKVLMAFNERDCKVDPSTLNGLKFK